MVCVLMCNRVFIDNEADLITSHAPNHLTDWRAYTPTVLYVMEDQRARI